MRDDAVLGRALPLDRGLGPLGTHNTAVYLLNTTTTVHTAKYNK